MLLKSVQFKLCPVKKIVKPDEQERSSTSDFFDQVIKYLPSKLKADRPHLYHYAHMPAVYRHTDKPLRLVMDRQMNATKHIISLLQYAAWSPEIHTKYQQSRVVKYRGKKILKS